MLALQRRAARRLRRFAILDLLLALRLFDLRLLSLLGFLLLGAPSTAPFRRAMTDVFSAADNKVDLFLRVAAPDQKGLYFIGLIQPLGAIMPLAEEQCDWVADLIEGEGALPDKLEMYREIADDQAKMKNSAAAEKPPSTPTSNSTWMKRATRWFSM